VILILESRCTSAWPLPSVPLSKSPSLLSPSWLSSAGSWTNPWRVSGLKLEVYLIRFHHCFLSYNTP
jgi:hypothetical protein